MRTGSSRPAFSVAVDDHQGLSCQVKLRGGGAVGKVPVAMMATDLLPSELLEPAEPDPYAPNSGLPWTDSYLLKAFYALGDILHYTNVVYVILCNIYVKCMKMC